MGMSIPGQFAVRRVCWCMNGAQIVRNRYLKHLRIRCEFVAYVSDVLKRRKLAEVIVIHFSIQDLR